MPFSTRLTLGVAGLTIILGAVYMPGTNPCRVSNNFAQIYGSTLQGLTLYPVVVLVILMELRHRYPNIRIGCNKFAGDIFELFCSVK
jgi:hypothetical protein